MDKRTQGVMFSSADHGAITPEDFFQQLNTEFRFQVDIAASHENAKCDRFIDEEMDALSTDTPWEGRSWCNPPYGRGIKNWVAKADEQASHQELTVMLLPARTDTKWFKLMADTANEIRFVAGRLRFEGNSASAPFPSLVGIWYGTTTTRMWPPPKGPYEWSLIWTR